MTRPLDSLQVPCLTPLIQVCGTPGSGKTTLMNLTHDYILEHDPNAIVQVITAWPKEPGTTLTDRIRKKIDTYPLTKEERDKGCNSYLLFNNAQDTYWDGELWDYFFKDIVQCCSGGPCAILFCGYGSPKDQPVEHDNGTPLDLPNIARVSLTPYDTHGSDFLPIGLLFSQDEFYEAVDRFQRL